MEGAKLKRWCIRYMKKLHTKRQPRNPDSPVWHTHMDSTMKPITVASSNIASSWCHCTHQASAYWFQLKGMFQCSIISSWDFCICTKNISSSFLFSNFSTKKKLAELSDRYNLYISPSHLQNRGPVFYGRRHTLQVHNLNEKWLS